jgi:hypothetical protein
MLWLLNGLGPNSDIGKKMFDSINFSGLVKIRLMNFGQRLKVLEP